MVDSNEIEDGIRFMMVNETRKHNQRCPVLSILVQKKRLPKKTDEHNVKLPMLSESIAAQPHDVFLKQSRQLVVVLGVPFTFDKKRFLVGKAPIHRSMQKLVSTLLQARLPQHEHITELTKYPREREI